MSECRTKEETDVLIKRLNRIEGQVRGIKNMLIENRECMDVLNQVRSVNAALRGVWEIIAARHIENCLENVSKKERNKSIEEILCHLQQLR